MLKTSHQSYHQFLGSGCSATSHRPIGLYAVDEWEGRDREDKVIEWSNLESTHTVSITQPWTHRSMNLLGHRPHCALCPRRRQSQSPL